MRDSVSKYLTDNRWHEYRKNVQRIVGMFYRQCILVIDGKYSGDDGLSTAVMISGVVIIREEQQPCSLDVLQATMMASTVVIMA
jgi:hypothetical protein